jgi:hypothetical protein
MSPRRKTRTSRHANQARPRTAARLRNLAAHTDARRWRRDARPLVLRRVVEDAAAITWSKKLFEALVEELYVDDSLEELMGDLSRLARRRHPQAIAIALVLRHSWRPDDLECILKRLGLPNRI